MNRLDPKQIFSSGIPNGQIPKTLHADGSGNIDWTAPRVAIVGTRASTPLGEADARRLAFVLAQHGAIVISGMAKGIDAAAHWGALQAGGMTVGVLATGLDIEYPATNRGLYRAMRQQGLLISEHPLGTRPTPYAFPERNRIIAGLADAVVVVEAKVHGGAMITAALADSYGREIMAVPGRPRDPLAQGPNQLILDGAWAVHDPADVIYILGLGEISALCWEANETPLTDTTKAVLAACGGSPATIDLLAERLDLPLIDLVRRINDGVKCGVLGRRNGLIWPIASDQVQPPLRTRKRGPRKETS